MGDTGARKTQLKKIFDTSLGVAVAIGIVSYLSTLTEAAFLMPPFGASCVIALAIPDSAFAQPRNIIGGHLLSTAVGMICFSYFNTIWWNFAIAVGLCTALMQLTRTLHPPAAADPVLLIMQGGASWSFLLAPVLIGSVSLVIIASLYNTVVIGRQYPSWHLISSKRHA